jgi:hypothetical protein
VGSRRIPPSLPDWRPAWVIVATTAGLGTVVGLSRLPFLTAPVSPDEGGFLVVGSQWSPGSALYGNYWVDRPPLLIAAFAVADSLGGPLALRLIGLAAVLLAIAAAAALGWYASGRRPTGAVASAWVVAALLATPLFGTRIVDGELLASPLVLGGLAALVASYDATPRTRTVALRGLAGGLAASAFLVKQDMVDVLVVACVLGAHTLWRRGLGPAGGFLLPLVGGAVATAGAVTAVAASRGTQLSALWGAVVTFRLAAVGLLGFSGPRLTGLVHAYVVTGALAVTVVAGLACLGTWRRAHLHAPSSAPWGTAALALIAWELAAAFAGGSYWSHYLIGLVPGVSLLVAVAFRAPGPVSLSLLATCLVYAGVCAAVAWTMQPAPPTSPSDDQVAASYVRDHARAGDSVVVAFGHADIVKDTGLGSPYPYLWALPAFVEDPHLTALDRLLRSPAAPRWFVAGGRLSQWGRPGVVLQRTVDRHYSLALTTQRWEVLRRDQRVTGGLSPSGGRRGSG